MNNWPLDPYEITEQKMPDEESCGNGLPPEEDPGLQVYFLGRPSSFGRGIIAIIILLVAIIWGATVKNSDPTSATNYFACAAILILGLGAAYLVCIKRK